MPRDIDNELTANRIHLGRDALRRVWLIAFTAGAACRKERDEA